MIEPFIGDIERITLENKYFRNVLFTGKNSQLVVMSLRPRENIGMETHDTVDQFFRVEQGRGVVFIKNTTYEIKDGSAFIIPAGTLHEVINTSRTHPLKLYTIYSPPEHPPNTKQLVKQTSRDFRIIHNADTFV